MKPIIIDDFEIKNYDRHYFLTKGNLQLLIEDINEVSDTVVRFKGTLNTMEDLLAIENPVHGDLYNVIKDGDNYVRQFFIYDGLKENKWVLMGKKDSYSSSEINNMVNNLFL